MAVIICSVLLLLVHTTAVASEFGRGGNNDTFIRHDLAGNNATGAARIVQENTAPAVNAGAEQRQKASTPRLLPGLTCFAHASGREPYPASTLRLIVLAAASGLSAGNSQQPAINTALQFLSLLPSLKKTVLSDSIAQALLDELSYSQIGTRRGPEYTSEVLLLALSAGLPQAIYDAFTMV